MEYLLVCMYSMCMHRPQKVQEGTVLLELELQAAVSSPMQMLETEPRSSSRATSALNH